MELTSDELKRALWLQKRLKIMRFVDRVTGFIHCPITFYKPLQKRWLDELTVLYNKKFCTKAANDYMRNNVGNPAFKRSRPLTPEEMAALRAEKEELDKILEIFRSCAYGGKS